jgi:RNA polymerase sigma-70 factor, ECF subfamily
MALSEIDRSLIERCLARDPSGWKEFVDRYLRLFQHVVQHSAQCRSVVLQPGDMDDLCAEIFLAVISDDFGLLRKFRGESSLSSYLVVIARRVAVKVMSRQKMAEAFGHVRASGNVDAEASSETGRIDREDLVSQMISGLPRSEAEVVRRFHLQGQSYNQISSELGLPMNSIGPTLTRARERLRFSLLATH